MGIYEQACRVIDEAGQAGGIDEVRRISERGWPSDVDGAPASPELLTEFAAVRAEAREVALREAAEECEVQARSFGRRPPTLYGESCQLTARSCASAILGLIRRSRRQT